MSHLDEIQNIIASLQELQSTGNYIFRGQKCFNFKLIPRAFREDDISAMTKAFGVDNRTKNSWFHSQKVKDCIDAHAPGARKNKHAITIINRLLNFCFYLMILNHSAYIFASSNITMISDKDKEMLQLKTPSHWKDPETFHHLFSGYFPRILEIYDLNNLLIQKAQPPEDLIGIDETFPQHYGAITAALDWTRNPLIAIYFALENQLDNSGFSTIYAINANRIAHDSPIKVMNKSIYVSNARAEAQQGVFTYFMSPCSFYIQNNALPSINHYHSRYLNNLDQQKFELHEFRIKRTPKNISFLQALIRKHGTTKEILFPDLDSPEIIC